MQPSQEQLAALIGENASATAVFGAPVTADGTTVIPVARAAVGFAGAPGGVGGGVDVRPLGFIEIRNGTARYRSIGDNWARVVLPVTAIAAYLVLAARSISRARTSSGRSSTMKWPQPVTPSKV
ncbi:MAG: sporulation protein [Nocardia sp.]|nr:sporulation protein [Nocardia sp.]